MTTALAMIFFFKNDRTQFKLFKQKRFTVLSNWRVWT
jgi:hypothetical protein